MKTIRITNVKPNPRNPRVIKDNKFQALVKSITDFPEMLEKRPLVCFTDTDGKFVVLGGNMRLRAAQEAGLKEIPVILADDWTEEQKQQFIVKDNVAFGEWNWDELANDWDEQQLADWGLDVWQKPAAIDYGVLEGESIEEKVAGLEGGVKKAIQIEFEAEHYEEAQELVKFWREQGLYIGGFLVEKLKEEKSKL